MAATSRPPPAAAWRASRPRRARGARGSTRSSTSSSDHLRATHHRDRLRSEHRTVVSKNRPPTPAASVVLRRSPREARATPKVPDMMLPPALRAGGSIDGSCGISPTASSLHPPPRRGRPASRGSRRHDACACDFSSSSSGSALGTPLGAGCQQGHCHGRRREQQVAPRHGRDPLLQFDHLRQQTSACPPKDG